MTILMSSNRYMFDVFRHGDEYYMTATTGGVAQYDITIRLTKAEADSFLDDENKAIALSIDLVTRTSAYEGRIVRPSIDPS
jgi:HSP20 family molecular chaperone IbpA